MFKNGIVYPITHVVIRTLKALNAVEYVKDFAAWCYAKFKQRDLDTPEIITAKNIGIDIFLAAKWLLVLYLITSQINNQFVVWVVYYLIATNLFTYFYYHVWDSGFKTRSDIDSKRRRFTNFILSIAFYLVCYSYLYQFPFAGQITWPENVVDTTNALYLSLANAFTLTYGGFAPNTQGVRVLFMTELINTFFFFTIIIGNAVPALENKD